MNITLTRVKNHKHSVQYKNMETGSNAYIMNDDLPSPPPETIVVTSNVAAKD